MESTDNPYAPPKAPIMTTNAGRILFPDMDTKEVRAFYFRSHNIITLSVLWMFWVLLYGALASSNSQMRHPLMELTPEALKIVRALQAAVFILAIIGCIRRDAWGRSLGLLACGFYIFGMNPFSVVVGIFGVGSLLRAKPLFGKNRMLHRDLKSEFKHRRRNRIG